MINIRGRRIVILAALPILTICTASRAVAQGLTATSIATVKVGPDKQVHLVYGDGHEVIAPKEKDQVDCASAKVAEDKRTAGWLVDFNNCCTSYPIPLVLVVYRDGKTVQRFDAGPIWDWQFLKSGKQVAFWTGPTHGAFTPHFELHDINGGRLLAKWDGHVKEKHPAWISGLKE